MKREMVIELRCSVRDDGTIHVSSPHIPLFQIVGSDEAEVEKLVLAVLEEHFQRNHQLTLKVRPTESLESFLERQGARRAVPAYVIAELSA